MRTTRSVVVCFLFTVAATLALLNATARAQLVPDGGTNVLDGVTNSVSGDLTVGTNGSFTLLSLINAAAVEVGDRAVIGRELGSFSNSVSVTSTGAVLAVTGRLYVGSNGWGNQLIITNGGRVASAGGTLGNDIDSSGNLAIVAGVGSLWSNSASLFIGLFGSSNSVLVSNGGIMTSGDGNIGVRLGYNTSSSNNVVLITDPGSAWYYNGVVSVGRSNSSGNRLIVSNGGTFRWGGSGISDASIGGTNSEILVTGAGSVWSNSHELIVGGVGGSRMVVDGGGSLMTGWAAIRGTNSEILVTGTGSIWNNRVDLRLGDSGYGHRLVVSNGGVAKNGTIAYLGITGGSNQVIVTSAGSIWTNQGNFYLGYDSVGNQLLVSDGGRVTVRGTQIRIGHQGGSSGNVATVTGAGSVWSNGTALYVGYQGSENWLVVSNGGQVVSGTGGIALGSPVSNPNSINNRAVVTGNGSIIRIGASLVVGYWSPGNLMTVRDNGAVVSSQGVYIGYNAPNNRLVVDNGTIRATNTAGTGIFEIQQGTNEFNGGLIDVDRLVMTTTGGAFDFNGGTLRIKGTTNSNGQVFAVGNGSSNATLELVGDSHLFANGLLIQTNATLTGTGTINGSVTNCGTIFLTNADQMIFTGPVVNKGLIIAVTGTPRFGSTFTNLGNLITTASINVANVSVSGPDIVLQFNSVSNYLHEVQASTNVSSGLWQTLTNGLLGTGSPITFTDVGGALTSNRTYRVLLH